MIQAEAEMLHKLALKVRDGEIEGFEGFGAMLVIVAFMEAMNENLPEIEPVDPLAEIWEEMLAVHEQAKEIAARWFNKEIASAEVIEELEPVLEEADDIASRAEESLIRAYDLPREDLREWRRETIEQLSSVFEPTPTPTPEE